MRRFLTVLLLFAIGVLLVVFFVSNRQEVFVSLDPFAPEDPALGFGPISLSLVLIIPLFVGYLLGALGMWLSGGRNRLLARERKREISRLREELKAEREMRPREEGALVPVSGADASRSAPAIRA
ncbi:lipopolysaccharide assembly protein LapA domain-containing protein [Parvularcula oceani]|uniref:lipopolysaccharide assembly protein LapA domain-containing protein n=1 Tax=Parvularcula oceani TaxID=1247963 RepID=UPI0005601E99|nr:LapA family protein [Parvularcula oceani]